jgi:4-aminobutyrate aminotransferase
MPSIKPLPRTSPMQAYLNGLLLLSCGQSTIRFMPPLMVTKEHVDEAVAILDATFGETQNA